jgi:hypothetical protein
MTQLLLWFIMSYGLMNIMVYGSIFQGLRDGIKKWGDSVWPLNGLFRFISGILSCPMCFSTWGGFFFGLFIFSPAHEFLQLNPVISWFFDGILSSGAVWVINSVVEWFEENRPNQNNVI